ncbi:hypothetical protein N9C35_04065 [Flavobacteriaceae bacterium]|nr:hypothetical protein [Flavobacteriaceae bacterium]
MNKDSKTISNSLRPQIDICKSNILSALSREIFFDVDGYVGKNAIKELRQNGYKIKYHHSRGSYKIDSK